LDFDETLGAQASENQKSKGKRQKAKMKNRERELVGMKVSSFLPFAFCLLIFDF
jgi:hypothetical protein